VACQLVEFRPLFRVSLQEYLYQNLTAFTDGRSVCSALRELELAVDNLFLGLFPVRTIERKLIVDQSIKQDPQRPGVKARIRFKALAGDQFWRTVSESPSLVLL